MDPTPAQLEAAGLTEVTTYEEIETAYANDAGPLRTWNAKNQNFPPVTSGYVKVGWQNVPTPQPQPVPVPTPTPEPSGASGIPIPPVAAALTRALVDDFTGTSLDPTKWTDGGNGVSYNGPSGGTAEGLFINKHAVTPGDSLLHLQAYPDPTNIVNCYEYTASLAASVNQWGGAGTHTKLQILPGAVSTVCMKFNTYPGIAPMAIYFGGGEIDWAEFNIIPAKNQPITKFYLTLLPGASQKQVEVIAPAGVDFSAWGVFRCALTTTSLNVTHSVDGINFVECGSFNNVSGATGAQNLCLQIQTGDVMPNPPADPSVSASSPIELLVDWVTVDVPV